jgi:hypothetical protein
LVDAFLLPLSSSEIYRPANVLFLQAADIFLVEKLSASDYNQVLCPYLTVYEEPNDNIHESEQPVT